MAATPPTTASRVVATLAKGGITRDDIRAEHLEFVYNGLRRLPSAPDFSAIGQVLPGNASSDRTDSRHPLWAVIVETRAAHPALDFVLDNVSTILQVPIQLFHGSNVTSPRIRQLVASGKVAATPLAVDLLKARDYNALLLTRRFWEHVQGQRKILIFQTDSLLCSGSDFRIDDFMSYDYLGSWWDRQRPVGIVADGGNGGLSLRDKNKTIQTIDRFPALAWPGGEDGYFAFHFEIIGAKIGKGDVCAKFCTQDRFQFRSFGAHKIHNLDGDSLRRFLDYCPDGKHILPSDDR